MIHVKWDINMVSLNMASTGCHVWYNMWLVQIPSAMSNRHQKNDFLCDGSDWQAVFADTIQFCWTIIEGNKLRLIEKGIDITCFVLTPGCHRSRSQCHHDVVQNTIIINGISGLATFGTWPSSDQLKICTRHCFTYVSLTLQQGLCLRYLGPTQWRFLYNSKSVTKSF